MDLDIDIENTDKIEECKFGRTCLKNFDVSLCCEIIEDGPNCLYVKPVSTFKSTNCSFIREIKINRKDKYVCTCPIRLKIYKKYKV